MAKTIIHGVKEDGTFDAELKRTPVLVTELIERFPKMCEMDVYKALCEIRESAERDQRIAQTYVQALKKRWRRHGMRLDIQDGNRSYSVAEKGITFGVCLAAVISYVNWHSIPWAIFHGFCSWGYVIYFALVH